jgi:hypothetical protein
MRLRRRSNNQRVQYSDIGGNMDSDQRQFVQPASIATIAPGGGPHLTTAPDLGGVSTSVGPSLQIDFEGLFLIEDKRDSMVVHLIDGPAVDLPTHVPKMTLPGGLVVPLRGLSIQTLPRQSSPSPLTQIDGKLPDEQVPPPPNDRTWLCLSRVPDLHVLCGATQILPDKRDAFASSITLTHGCIEALPPDQEVGLKVVWICAGPSGVLMCRAFSNRVRYTCPTNGAAVVMLVGSHEIHVAPDVTTQMSVTNLPNSQMSMPQERPNMDHFFGLMKIVDSKFVPTIVAQYNGPLGPGTEPFGPVEDPGTDWCPGGILRDKNPPPPPTGGEPPNRRGH